MQQALASTSFPREQTRLWASSKRSNEHRMPIVAAPRGLWISIRPQAIAVLSHTTDASPSLIARAAERSSALILHQSAQLSSSSVPVPVLQTRADALRSLRARAEIDVLGGYLGSALASQIVPCCALVDTDQRSAAVLALVPRVHFYASPVEPLRVTTSMLGYSLNEVQTEHLLQGFLTLDQRRRAVLLGERSASEASCPLVGVWLIGARSPHDFACWALCARFALMCPKSRLRLQDNCFLLALAHDRGSAFEFFELDLHACMHNIGEQFALYETSEEQLSSAASSSASQNDTRLSATRRCILRDAIADEASTSPTSTIPQNPENVQRRMDTCSKREEDKNNFEADEGLEEAQPRPRHERALPSPSSRKLSRSSDRTLDAAVNTDTDWPPNARSDASKAAFVERFTSKPTFTADATRSLRTSNDATAQTVSYLPHASRSQQQFRAPDEAGQFAKPEAASSMNNSDGHLPHCTAQDKQCEQKHDIERNITMRQNNNHIGEQEISEGDEYVKQLADRLEQSGREQAWRGAPIHSGRPESEDDPEIVSESGVNPLAYQEISQGSFNQCGSSQRLEQHVTSDNTTGQSASEDTKHEEDMDTTLENARSQLDAIRKSFVIDDESNTQTAERTEKQTRLSSNSREEQNRIAEVSNLGDHAAHVDDALRDENQPSADPEPKQRSSNSKEHHKEPQANESQDLARESDLSMVVSNPSSINDDICDDHELQSMIHQYFSSKEELDYMLASISLHQDTNNED